MLSSPPLPKPAVARIAKSNRRLKTGSGIGKPEFMAGRADGFAAGEVEGS
jgi:hypothetical protein